MPTNAQRAILGGAGALGAMFKGRIAALQARQSMLLGMKEQEQAQEKIDVNRIFAEAQLLGAQTQAKKSEAAENDPIAELKRQIAVPLLQKVNMGGLDALSDRELETYYGLLDIKPSAAKGPPEINNFEDLIGQYLAGNVGDEDFIKGADLFETGQEGGLYKDTFLTLLRSHPGKTSETVLESEFGAIKKYKTADVAMDLKQIVTDAREETDRQIREGHPGQVSKKFRQIIEGNYDPEADELEAKANRIIDGMMQDPVISSYMERAGAGNNQR